MLVSLSVDHPQYSEIMRDVWSRFPGGPKPVVREAFPDQIDALKAHMDSHRLTRMGWVANQKEG